MSENLRVFLRIRPLGVKARPALKGNGGGGKARGEWFPEKKARKGAKTNRKVKNEVCLVVNGNESVTLTPPPSYLVDSKRAKCEVYNGFSCVFPPDSLQVSSVRPSLRVFFCCCECSRWKNLRIFLTSSCIRLLVAKVDGFSVSFFQREIVS